MDGVTWRVKTFAEAISVAEGFGVAGSLPQRAHNPGDLVMPGWTGPTLGAEHISVFADDATGWAALYRQLLLIVSGRSHVYGKDVNISQLAHKWTPVGSDEWARNVVAHLNAHGGPVVTIETRLSEVMP